MPRKQELKWKLQDLSDTEISAAIRYLDPDVSMASNPEGLSAGIVICVSLLVLLLGCVAFIWFYCRALG